MRKKIYCWLFFFFLFFFLPLKVFASENIEIENNTLKGQSVESGVKISKASWFKVTIPKKIVIDGSKKDSYSEEYKVTVEADLSGHETIYVDPEPSFTMTDSMGFKQVNANVSLEDTSFTVPKSGTLNEETTGTVTTSNVEAGLYTGDFNFNIHKDIVSDHTFGDYKDEGGYFVRYCSICGEKDVKGVVTYNLSYTLNGGSATNPSTYNVETATFNLNNPTKLGYTFSGWTGSNGTTAQKTVTIPKGTTGNKNYTANFTANTNTKYTVYHQQEQLDGTYKTYETEILKGTTDTTVTPNRKNYTGFNSPSGTSVLIKPDGSASVTYKYKRKSFTVTCEDWIVDASNNKKTNITSTIPLSTDSKYSSRSITMKYGETINASAWGANTEGQVYKTGFHFVSTSGNTTVTGNITVYRYFWAYVDLNPMLDSVKRSNGIDADNSNATIGTCDIYINGVKDSTGVKDWYQPEPYGAVIKIDNIKAASGYKYIGNSSYSVTASDKIVELNPPFERLYTISYNVNGGSLSGQVTSYTKTSNNITLPTPTKTGYTFLGWTGSNGTTAQKTVTIPKGSTGNKSYTANWQINTYTVNVIPSRNGTKNNSGFSGHTFSVAVDGVTKVTNTTAKYTITVNYNQKVKVTVNSVANYTVTQSTIEKTITGNTEINPAWIYSSNVGLQFEYVGDNNGSPHSKLLVITDKKTWENAESYAQSLGGHLVMIKSQGLQNYIVNTILANSQVSGLDAFWIGCHDKTTEGKWQWVDGSLLSNTFSYWNSGEPNNSGSNEDYGEMYINNSSKGKWNDLNGTQSYAFVVQIIL